MNGSMNDLKEEKGTREELRRSQAAPRRSGGGLKRALMVILALVVVLAVVVAAAWKDLSSLDSVRRLFSYNKVTQDEQSCVRSATTAATPLRCSATI
jgi:predicted metalloprotease